LPCSQIIPTGNDGNSPPFLPHDWFHGLREFQSGKRLRLWNNEMKIPWKNLYVLVELFADGQRKLFPLPAFIVNMNESNSPPMPMGIKINNITLGNRLAMEKNLGFIAGANAQNLSTKSATYLRK